MKLMGQKGQAFSTFKLLIAAIVAVVILMILLSILNVIDFSPRNQPIVGASDALEAAYQTPSALESSQSVTFTQDYTLSKKAVVERANIGISEDQICLSLGDYQGMTTSGFTGGVICTNSDGDCSNANRITYEGGGNRNVKLSVLCYDGEELPEIVGTTSPDSIYENIEEDWIDQCECTTDTDLQKQICCAIILRVTG